VREFIIVVGLVTIVLGLLYEYMPSPDRRVYDGIIVAKQYSPGGYKTGEEWSVVVQQGHTAIGIEVNPAQWPDLFIGEEVLFKHATFTNYYITEAIVVK